MKRLLSVALVCLALSAQTARFPSAVVTDSDLKVAKNFVQTKLRYAISASQTVISVHDASRIEANMLLTIEREVVSVTSVIGSTLTVVRGFDGTTAVAHNAGREVVSYPTAWDKNALAAEVKAIQSALGPELSNITADSRQAGRYLWSQAPGISLVAGVANVVTLAPCPQGVSGTNTSYSVYISDGIGGGESVSVIGGTCASGAPSGTLIFVPANSYSGSWTVGSASGGIQEAVCALPSAGGDVEVASDVTLYANVGACAKSNVRVTRRPNVVFSGSYTVLSGSYASRSKSQVFHSTPTYSTLTRLHDGTRYDIGGFPETREFGFDGSPAVQSLVGTINVPDDGAINPLFAAGVAGYGRAERQGADAVGVYGGGECAGALTQCWGGNLTVQNGNMTIGGSNLVGLEVDSNNSASGANAPAIIQGITSIGNFPANASGYKHAYTSQVVNTYAWDISYISRDGASGVAFQAGTVAEGTSPSNSQISQWASRSSAGVTRTAYQFNDSDGVFWVRGTTGGNIAFDVSGTAAASMLIHPNYVIMGRPLRLYSGTLTDIGNGPVLSNGDMVYCTDCQVTSGSNNTCAVGGTGALGVQVNGALRCFNAQN